MNLVQVGIDLASMVRAGHPGWTACGGHGSGRKLPVVLAGLLLGDKELAPINALFPQVSFGEDEQTAYGEVWPPRMGGDAPDMTPFIAPPSGDCGRMSDDVLRRGSEHVHGFDEIAGEESGNSSSSPLKNVRGHRNRPLLSFPRKSTTRLGGRESTLCVQKAHLTLSVDPGSSPG